MLLRRMDAQRSHAIDPVAILPTFVPAEVLFTTTGRSTAMRNHCLGRSPARIDGNHCSAVRAKQPGRFGGSHYMISYQAGGHNQLFRGSQLVQLLSKQPRLLAPFGITLMKGKLRVPDAIELNGILDWHGTRGPKVRFVTWPGMGDIGWKAYAALLQQQRLPIAQVGNEFFHDLGVHYQALFVPERVYDLIRQRLKILFWAQCLSDSSFNWSEEIRGVAASFDAMTANAINAAVTTFMKNRGKGFSVNAAMAPTVFNDLVTMGDTFERTFLDERQSERFRTTGHTLTQTDHRVLRLLGRTFLPGHAIAALQREFFENIYRYSHLQVS
jgi:hypothetical protein